jgi:hypothetical protein
VPAMLEFVSFAMTPNVSAPPTKLVTFGVYELKSVSPRMRIASEYDR